MNDNDIFLVIGHALLAVLGSCVRWMHGPSSSRKLARLGVEALSSSFIGIIIFLIHGWLNFNVYLAFCLAGLFGHFGADCINLLTRYVLKKANMISYEALKQIEEQKNKEESK